MKINNIYQEILMGNYTTPTDEMAKMSLEIITKIYPIYKCNIKTVDDAFLFGSALSYLNAYIKVPNCNYIKTFKEFYSEHPEIYQHIDKRNKQYNKSDRVPYVACNNKQDAYKCFKKLVIPFMTVLDNLFPDDKNIKVSPQYESGSTYGLIEIYKVQFSFHRIAIYKDNNKKYWDMMNDSSTYVKWDGLRLQPLAMHVLKCATELDNLSEDNLNIINKYMKQDTLEK